MLVGLYGRPAWGSVCASGVQVCVGEESVLAVCSMFPVAVSAACRCPRVRTKGPSSSRPCEPLAALLPRADCPATRIRL